VQASAAELRRRTLAADVVSEAFELFDEPFGLAFAVAVGEVVGYPGADTQPTEPAGGSEN